MVLSSGGGRDGQQALEFEEYRVKVDHAGGAILKVLRGTGEHTERVIYPTTGSVQPPRTALNRNHHVPSKALHGSMIQHHFVLGCLLSKFLAGSGLQIMHKNINCIDLCCRCWCIQFIWKYMGSQDYGFSFNILPEMTGDHFWDDIAQKLQVIYVPATICIVSGIRCCAGREET